MHSPLEIPEQLMFTMEVINITDEHGHFIRLAHRPSDIINY